MNRSIVVKRADITETNSVTYADVAGLYAGLDRFPGERSDEFLKRVQQAAALDQTASYEGLLNQLSLQFGLAPVEMFTLSSSAREFSVGITVGGLTVSSQEESIAVATRVVDPDFFWNWRQVSEIVADINRSRTFRATLLRDGPAVQLAWQANSRQIRNASVSGTAYYFPEGNIEESSVLFNVAVPNWVFSENGRSILFDRVVTDGTSVTYRHLVCPYSIVGYPAAILSLTDPALKAAAVTEGGTMIYQVREYLHEVAKQDRSYWGI